MPNMTLKELIDRINTVPKNYGINPIAMSGFICDSCRFDRT